MITSPTFIIRTHSDFHMSIPSVWKCKTVWCRGSRFCMCFVLSYRATKSPSPVKVWMLEK